MCEHVSTKHQRVELMLFFSSTSESIFLTNEKNPPFFSHFWFNVLSPCRSLLLREIWWIYHCHVFQEPFNQNHPDTCNGMSINIFAVHWRGRATGTTDSRFNKSPNGSEWGCIMNVFPNEFLHGKWVCFIIRNRR